MSHRIFSEPSEGINTLCEKYKFGQRSEFWDDFVFSTVILPVLNKIVSLKDLRKAVTKYCEIDHSLFLSYIRRDEDPVRFRRAFWNVNVFGKALASRFAQDFALRNKSVAAS